MQGTSDSSSVVFQTGCLARAAPLWEQLRQDELRIEEIDLLQQNGDLLLAGKPQWLNDNNSGNGCLDYFKEADGTVAFCENVLEERVRCNFPAKDGATWSQKATEIHSKPIAQKKVCSRKVSADRYCTTLTISWSIPLPMGIDFETLFEQFSVENVAKVDAEIVPGKT